MNKLNELRTKTGLTQKQLADTAGVHINIISRIERGERSSSKLQLDTAAKLAKALGCHAEDLLDSQPSEGYNILKEWRDSHNVTQKEFLETYTNNEQRYTSELRSIEKGIAKTFSRKAEAEDHRNK